MVIKSTELSITCLVCVHICIHANDMWQVSIFVRICMQRYVSKDVSCILSGLQLRLEWVSSIVHRKTSTYTTDCWCIFAWSKLWPQRLQSQWLPTKIMAEITAFVEPRWKMNLLFKMNEDEFSKFKTPLNCLTLAMYSLMSYVSRSCTNRTPSICSGVRLMFTLFPYPS